MAFTRAVETQRARLMHDIGDANTCSWQLASASFARNDALTPEEQNAEEAEKLIERIEQASENLNRHRRGRGKTKGGKNDTATLTEAFGDGGKGTKVCDDCGGPHETKNCWSNAEKVIARRDAAKARKAKKKGKNNDSAHLTQAQKGPDQATHHADDGAAASAAAPQQFQAAPQGAVLSNVVAMLLESRLKRGDTHLMLQDAGGGGNDNPNGGDKRE